MNKRRIYERIAAFLLITALILQTAGYVGTSAAGEADGTITAGELYMRTGPGTDYDNIMLNGSRVLLTYGQKVTIIGEKNGWYHIRAVVDGEIVEGYSLSGRDSVQYITVDSGTVRDENKVLARVTASALNLRMGSSTDYEKVMIDQTPVVFSNGQELTVLGENNGWYHITADYNGSAVEGYVIGTYIEIIWGADNEIASDAGIISPKDNGNSDSDNSADNTGKTGDSGNDKSDTDKKDSDKTDKSDDGDKTEATGKKDKEKDKSDVFDPTDVSAGVPEGYEITELTWDANFDIRGTVTAGSGLNMRKKASPSAAVVAVLKENQEVTVIKSVIANAKNEKGETYKTRWYRVVANIGGEYAAGYVLSEYITLDCSDGLEGYTRYSKQVLLKNPDGDSKKVKTSKKKTVKLAKGSDLMILEDVIGTDGNRYFKVTAEYKNEECTGYIPALRVAPEYNAADYTVQVLTKIPEPAVTEEAVAEEPVEEKPAVTFDTANAVIKGSAGLTVAKEPKGSSERLFTDDKKLILLYNGDSIEVINTIKDAEYTWVYIRFYYNSAEYYGYIRAAYVEAVGALDLIDTMSQTSSSTVDFETRLAMEGFPESYKEALRQLHAQYPSWEFKAFHTGLDWDQVIATESEVGVNLIPNSKGVEWKSLETGAYSWKTDTFTVFDGSTWVTASKAAIEYYMDPRNFLTYDRIFQYEVLTYSPQYQDYNGVANIIKNTAMSNASYQYTDNQGETHTISFTDTFLMAAEYTGVSPFHLASRVKQEVTLGTDAMSNSVTGTVEGYEGLYNYYNIGAYHSTESGGAIRNGLKFARSGTSNVNCLIPWTDPFRAILGGAFYIGNNYINRGQDTIYLQKFNVTANNTYGHQYMANVEAPYSEGIRVYRGYVNPEEIPIVFSIPVYLNMPEETCGVPEKQYNPNNWLKSLKIYNNDGDKLALTPTFDYTTLEYSLIVDSATDYLNIKASTISSLATIEGKGAVYPNTGINRFTVKVTAENGDIREYIINVVREEAPEPTDVPEEPVPTPDVTEVPEEPVPTPDETVYVTDEPTPAPDETVYVTDEPTPVPDETVYVTDEPVPVPDETVYVTDEPMPTPDETVYVTDEPEPTPDETVYVTDEPVPTPDETVYVTDEPTPAPDENSAG